MATTREIMSALRRQRALSGESLDPNVAESIVRAGLQDESERALRSRGIALQERAFEQGIKERERERKAQNLAGTIGAGVQVGGMYFENKLQNRALDIAAGRAATEKELLSSLFPDSGASTAISGAAAGGAKTLGEIGIVNQFEATSGTAAGTGTAASGIATGVAGAAGAFVGSQFGKGEGKQLATGIGSALGTALMTSNPYTIAIAGIVSYIGGDKVICGVMNKYGYISDEILALDNLYSILYVDTPTHVGYRFFADKVTVVIRESRVKRAIIAPFAIAWAHAMAEKVDRGIIVKYWHRYLGNFLVKVISPICKFVGRRLLNG